MDMDAARMEHRELGLLFDPNRQHQPTSGTRAPKIKKLVSQMLLEAIRIDREMGIYMFDMYNKGWLAVAGEAKVWQFDSVEEYQAYRKNDFGTMYVAINNWSRNHELMMFRAFWAMTEFAVGMRLSDDDRKLIEPVMEPIEKAIVWTNDYWSFDRENYEAAVNGSRLINVVEVIRRSGNLSVDEAKAEARRLLIDAEKEYVFRKEVLYAQNPLISLGLKRWVELVGAIVGGTHYWASSAPRHRAWRNKDTFKNVDEPVFDVRPLSSHMEEQRASNEGSSTRDGSINLSSDGGSSSSQQPSQTEPSDYESVGSHTRGVALSPEFGSLPKLEEVDVLPKHDRSHKVRPITSLCCPNSFLTKSTF